MIDLNSLITALVTAPLAALLTSIVYMRQAKIDLQKEFDSRFNTKKWESYLGVNDIIQGIYYVEQIVEDDEQINLEDQIQLLGTKVLLIGSNDVIKAFGFWQKQRQHGDHLHDTKERLHNLIVEMRKDLGLQDSRFELETMQGLVPRRFSR